MPTGLEDIRATLRADQKKGRRILIISVILFAALCLLILCCDYEKLIDHGRLQFITPWQAFKSIWYGAKMAVVEIRHGTNSDSWIDLFLYTLRLPDQNAPVGRFWLLCMTAISGAILSLSGTVYQSAMRNPMAVPTMLGSTASVNLAKMLILVNMGISAFYNMTWQMYAICYAFSFAALLIILLAGKLSGGKHVSIVDMLIAGTMINRLIELYNNYLRDHIDETTLMEYQSLQMKAYSVYNQFQNLVVLLIVALVVMIPFVLMRFSYNAISFEDGDARCLGVNPNAMRVYAMVGGAILTTAVMIHYGDVGTLALIVPHICRYTFGSDFRRVVTTSAFYGAFILVIAWFVSNFTWIGSYQIPVGSIISLVVMPVLIWFSWKQRHGWE